MMINIKWCWSLVGPEDVAWLKLSIQTATSAPRTFHQSPPVTTNALRCSKESVDSRSFLAVCFYSNSLGDNSRKSIVLKDDEVHKREVGREMPCDPLFLRRELKSTSTSHLTSTSLLESLLSKPHQFKLHELIYQTLKSIFSYLT